MNRVRASRSTRHLSRRTLSALRPFFLIGVGLAFFSLVSCGAPTPLLRPNGVAAMPDGTLYVMDRGNYRVVHMTTTGQFLDAFGQLGTGPNDIFAGWDIAYDAAGNLYICDLVRDESGSLIHDGVKVFDPRGHLVREIGRVDYDYYEEEVHVPYGIDIDAAGRVYIADNSLNTLRVFDAQGEPLGTFFEPGTGPGLFYGLDDVVVDDSRGLLYASDSINSYIQQFALSVGPNGEVSLTHRLTFGTYGTGPGEFAYPQYLAVDEARDRLYVNDMANYRIQVFDSAGNFLEALELPGVENWQGMGIAIGTDGTVYIADTLNNVIWSFGASGESPRRIEIGGR